MMNMIDIAGLQTRKLNRIKTNSPDLVWDGMLVWKNGSDANSFSLYRTRHKGELLAVIEVVDGTDRLRRKSKWIGYGEAGYRTEPCSSARGAMHKLATR